MSGLFRARLNKKFDEKTATYHTSINEDLRMFEEDIIGTEAHNIMLHERNIITEKQLSIILGALESIRKSEMEGLIEVSADFEDIHEFIESNAIQQIGLEFGGLIHTGRSRNDQVMLDMKMVTRNALLDIAGNVLMLIEALLDRATESLETVMVMYTHGQHAQIGTLAHYLSSIVETLFRDFGRFLDCFKRVNSNPLGGGPIGGTSINIDRQRTTELLGFERVQENSIDATSGRDWALETASVCAILMSNLSRVAADFIEWSTKEFSYLEVSDEYSSSSSIMPQKKNPSTIELLRGKTSVAYGALLELLTMVKGVPTGYYQDLQQTKISLWNTLDNCHSSLDVITGVVRTIKVYEERMLKITEDSYIYALELCEALVEETELNFREAYNVTATLVKRFSINNQNLKDVTPQVIEEITSETVGIPIILDQRLINDVFNPHQALKRRKSLGSPNPEMVNKFISIKKRESKEKHAYLNGEKEKIRDALNRLSEIVSSYTS